jgi:hypothetical protein
MLKGFDNWIHRDLLNFVGRFLEQLDLSIYSNCQSIECIDGELICDLAARNGYLKVLKWAHNNGRLPLNKWTCASAAQGGQLEVLKWLYEIDCDWDDMTIHNACVCEYFEVLEWAKSIAPQKFWKCLKSNFNIHSAIPYHRVHLKWGHRPVGTL